MHRCSCCFLRLAQGVFRDLKENLRKIFEGNINPLKCLKKCAILIINSEQRFVMALWWQKTECSITLYQASEGTVLFTGKECKFPAAANSCGTKKSILCIWNSIISIHSFLSSGVCENTLWVSVEHTHTHMHSCREVRWETTQCPCLPLTSVLGNRVNMHVWLNWIWECGRWNRMKKCWSVKVGSAWELSEWLVGLL